ncbi:MAG: branched-chain amino acid ABC transporter permease [Oricola sp.]|nr:MAG: branched-chain amino acid ABC transporter permease [Oricola sp.]
MLSALVPLVVDALAGAALIFFVAVGLTLVFSVLRILNVTHGSLYAIGAYCAAVVGLWVTSAGLSPWLSFLTLFLSAVLVAVLLGPVIERLFLRWTYDKTEAVQILVTFGLFLILEDLQRLVFGVSSFYQDTPMMLLGTVNIGGIIYLNYQLLIIALAAVVLLALRFMLTQTSFGRLMTTVVEDREIATAIGINTQRIYILAFTLGVFLAALGGALATPTMGVAPGLGAETMVLAFAVAAIGGLGQIEGAAVAAIIVALARVLAIYFAPALDAVAPYIVMLLVLMVRPNGLFGAQKLRKI